MMRTARMGVTVNSPILVRALSPVFGLAARPPFSCSPLAPSLLRIGIKIISLHLAVYIVTAEVCYSDTLGNGLKVSL